MTLEQFSRISELPQDIDSKNNYKISGEGRKSFKLKHKNLIIFLTGMIVAAFFFSTENGYGFLLNSWHFSIDYLQNLIKF